MAKCIRHEPCPRCVARGLDSRGDNLGIYEDGSVHCFACGYHPVHRKSLFKIEEKPDGNENKEVLPHDFSREVPARAWRWLLQYGLPYSYWKSIVGWSEWYSRLVFTVGRPVRFSIGRYIGTDPVVERGNVLGEAGDRLGRFTSGQQRLLDQGVSVRPPTKWKIWGDRGEYVEVLYRGSEGPVVLVEDIISAHKVAQVTTAIPLFGTKVLDSLIRELIALKRPVKLWLDQDQYTLLAAKLNRVQTFLTHPVAYISTEKDPKRYDSDTIKRIIEGSAATDLVRGRDRGKK